MRLWKKGILLGWILMYLLSGSAFGGEKFISEIDRGMQVFIKADEDGQIWSVYFDPTNGLHLHNAESGKDLLVASGRRAVAERSGL